MKKKNRKAPESSDARGGARLSPRHSPLTGSDAGFLTSSDASMLQTCLKVQERGIRIFTRDLQVLYDNVTDRSQRYPLYTDKHGAVVSIPPEGKVRAVWPVYRVLTQGVRNEREYTVSVPGDGQSRFRVAAYPVTGDGGQSWILEETERIERNATGPAPIEALESEMTELLIRTCELLSSGGDPGKKPIRLENPHLRPCYEIKNCGRVNCPAYHQKENLRCWEILGTFCPDGSVPKNPLEKIRYCVDCEVLLSACPDSLTHVWEQINQLFHMIQMKSEEVQKAHQFVQQAEKAATIAELTMGIAHEIKNPLSVILGRLDCLGLEFENLSPADLVGDLETIRAHAVRMRRILDDFLGLARPSPPEFHPVRMSEAVSEVLNMTRKTLEKTGVRIAVDVPAKLPRFHADSVQVQQVLINLLLNARDAMPKGGDLTIRARSRTNRGIRGLDLSVRDTGEGIPPELHEKVFSPLYTTKSGSGGSGLGLAVCRRIMNRHEGAIRLESRPGEGSTFTLWFPLKRSKS